MARPEILKGRTSSSSQVGSRSRPLTASTSQASTSPIQLGRSQPLTHLSVSFDSTKGNQQRYTHPDTLSDIPASPWTGASIPSSGRDHPPEPFHRPSDSVSSTVSVADLAGSSPRDYPVDSSRITRRLVADSDPVHLPAARSSSRGREPAVARILAEHPVQLPASYRREHSPSWDHSSDGHRARSYSTPRTGSPGVAPIGSIPIGSASLHRTHSDADGDYSQIPRRPSLLTGRSSSAVRDTTSSFNGPTSFESRGSNGSGSTHWSERLADRDPGTGDHIPRSRHDSPDSRDIYETSTSSPWSNTNRQRSAQQPADGSEGWKGLAWAEQEGRSRAEGLANGRFMHIKRSQSVNAAADRADSPSGGLGGSPHSESAGRFRMLPNQGSPRIGASGSSPRNLPSMPEEFFGGREAALHESDHDADANGGTATARGSPQRGTASLAPGRPSRSRSNSSAAVLALHGLTTKSIEQQQQRQAAQSRDDPFAPWGYDARNTLAGRSGLHHDGHTHEARYGEVTAPERLGGLSGSSNHSQFDKNIGLPPRTMHHPVHTFERSQFSGTVPYSRVGSSDLLDGIEDLKRHQPQFSAHTDIYETESRRHSIATAADVDRYEHLPYQNRVDNGISPFGQRRAVGFEVHNELPARSVWPTDSRSHDQPAPRSMFSGGALAFSDDDLSSLSLGIDHHHHHHHHQDVHGQDSRGRMNARIPSSAAAVTGFHSSSMPPMFSGRQHEEEAEHHSQAFRGRTLTTIGGEQRSAASSWDPYHSSDMSPSRHGLDHTAKKFRALSIGFVPDAQRQPLGNGAFGGTPPRQADEVFAVHPVERLDSDRRQSGRRPLDIQQQSGSPGSGPFMSSSHQPVGLNQQQASQYIADPPRNGFDGRPPQQLQQLRTTNNAGSLHGPDDLTDYAIASLATLGPMAPLGGPGGGGHGGMAHGGADAHNAPALLHEMGKGVPLSTLSRDTQLYIVEFKQGRTDLYFRETPARASDGPVQKGDLAIVEADRGRDLGTVVNDSISVAQVQMFLVHQAELVNGLVGSQDGATSGAGGSAVSRLTRTINPKRLYGKASPADLSLLYSKAQDEERALQLCITKVNQRGLAMTVVAAEMQWDRRKLTFYYTASMRVDFRALVQEMFRLFKTRIWMCHLTHAGR